MTSKPIFHKYESPEEKVKKATDMIKYVRTNLLRTHPFYAQIALNLRLKPCGIGTMGVDGVNLFFDPEFVCGASKEYLEYSTQFYKGLLDIGVISNEDYQKHLEGKEKWFKPKTVAEMEFIVLHEIRHVVNDHLPRGQGLDKGLFNKAADFNINNRLAWELYKSIDNAKKTLPILEHCCINEKYCSYSDGKYKEWISEKIYKDLLDNKGEDGKGCGESFDVHMDISDEQKEQIKDLIISASKVAGDSTPSDIRDMVKEWTQPRVHWNKLLDRDLKTQNIHDYNYQLPASRSWFLTNSLRSGGMIRSSQYVINPSYTREDSVEVAFFWDTSGSITNDILSKCASEVAAIMRQFSQCKIHMACWDTKIHNYQVFDQGNLNDLKKYKIMGHGGTDVNCVGKFMIDNKINPNNTVIMTDGEFSTDYGLFKKTKGLIWVLFGNPEFKAPVGKTVQYID